MNQTYRHEGTTWVFGGSSGIGLAAARALAEQGHRVVIAARTPARLSAALAHLPQGVDAESIDVSNAAALHAALGRHSPPRHLVISVGGGSAIGAYRSLSETQLRDTFEGKFWVMQRITLAATRLMQAGSITWVTGAAARAAIPGMAALAATNGALHAMIGPLARELAPIRINAVSPGFIDTPYWERALDDDTRRQTYAAMAALVPVQRVGAPEDVAAAILMCVNNGFVTGTVIDCDGGRRLV
jgi:NAD(P)-dependent dehydrogenase (short-subunit alcohol dehydrogenase family)